MSISRRGTPNRRPMAVVAIASVGETTAPRTNDSAHGRSATQCATPATPTVVTATSPIASNPIGRMFCRSSRSPVLNAVT